jgi:hypothetical protein
MLEVKTRLVAPALMAFAGIALVGCSASQDGGNFPPPPTTVATANFKLDLATSTLVVPYPYDLYFAIPGAPADGTLNLPTVPWRSAAVQSGMNALDGWSTNSAIDTSFSLPIDPSSISGSTVKIIKLWLDPATKAPATNPNYLPVGATSPVAGVLTYGTDFTADVSPDYDSGGKFLRIIPKKPLAASMGPAANNGGPNAGKVLNVGYLVVLTNGLKSTDGQSMGADTLYADMKAAPAPTNCSTSTDLTVKLTCLTKAHLGIAQAVGIDPASVILSWSFSTQSVDDVLAATVAKATPQPTLIVPTGLTTQAVGAAGKADIYVGSTKLPYYLTPPANANDSASVMTKFWTAAGGANLTMLNPSPLKVTDVTVPLLVTIPRIAGPGVTGPVSACPGKPAGGWPVVIFQHGVTNDRTYAFPVAEAYADACFIVVSMDLPLHGITNTASPFYCTPTKPQCLGATERTFNIDIQNNTTGAAGKDGVIDTSGGKDGTTYFNLSTPLTWRDNLRQSEVDLGNLTKSVPGLAIASSTGTTLVGVDPTQIHFLAHSIGAMVGGAHVHFSNDTRTAALANPGGPLMLIAREPGYFGDRAKLVIGASATPGSYAYNMVLRDVQAVVDAADPYNHVKAAAQMHPLLLFEVQNDQTIPNSSTNALISAAGLTKAKTIGPNAVAPGAGRYTLFTQGYHGTLLNPSVSAAATAEMQRQAVLYAASASAPGGPFVTLTNPAVLDLN